MKKYLFSSIIIVFFSFTQVQFIKAQVAVQDSLALVDLYNSTNGPNWTNKTNWLTGQVKNWYGIIVNANRVVNLNLIKQQSQWSYPNFTGKFIKFAMDVFRL